MAAGSGGPRRPKPDANGNAQRFPEVEAFAAMHPGATMLRRELLVEVEQDHIVVRVTGTSYAVSYFRMANSTGLVARNLPVSDHRAPMSRLEFIKNSWELAKAKAQE
jgi:hypothetical protein